MTMKPTHITRYLKFALFLAILCSFTTAYAYDFEVDGIYYNKTSATTVEVTYKDTNYNSYTGDVSIPSAITRNGNTYIVTTVGDYAFYNSEGVSNLTIPETVTSIGECAFYGCHPHTMTCLAMEPPTLNNSFDEWRMTRYDYWLTSDPLYILYLRPEAFYNYYHVDEYGDVFWSDWFSYFSFTLKTEAEQTPSDIYFDVHERFSRYDGRFLHAVIYVYGGVYSECFVRVNGGQWENYQDAYLPTNEGIDGIWVNCDEWPGSTFSIEAVLVEYGDLPSDIVTFNYEVPCYAPDAYYDTYYCPYDFIVDGISYRRLNNNSVAVAPDVEIITHHPYQFKPEDCECYCHGLYNGHVEIPNTIEYDGKMYNVTSIDMYTFGNYGEYYYGPDKNWFNSNSSLKLTSNNFPYESYEWYTFYYGVVENRNLTSIILPNSINTIYDYAFYKCINLERLTIPNSVDYIGEDAFSGCDSIKYLHITGEGEWTAGALDVAVQRLDIASGITAIPGLKVNPREVYCYAKVPPTCDENTFTDYTGTLHVPESSLAAYFTAPYWCNFANIVGDAVELTDITLNKDSAELLVDEQLTLNATIQPANANIDSITWSSSNEEIATVVNGVVTAKALGECDIIVTCLDKRAICHIKVVEQVTTITLDQHRASLLPNHILTLTPTVTPVPTDLVVTSSNPSVAAARLANGKVQVVGVSVGTAIIKVASADGNAIADSCFVNVYTEAGDVDGDGFVKIDDVTALIDHLPGSNSSIDVGNADINYDGVVSIADVTELIDYLLGGSASMSTRETFTVNGVSFTMIRVPAGSFMMGATEEQGSDANSWEKPVHEVTLTSSYLIGETEVTQELWLAVMGTNPSKHEGSLQKPVENVSWLDCQEFISQLNALTGLTFRMPTEAEWEYAARGANRSRGYKYAGSNDIADVGNVSSSTTMPVGSLQPNELNIYDMSGNVDEWVWDLFGYYTSEPQIDPTGPADGGSDHMYRGGSWYGGANVARVSYRFFRASTFKRGTMGLRLAL